MLDQRRTGDQLDLEAFRQREVVGAEVNSACQGRGGCAEPERADAGENAKHGGSMADGAGKSERAVALPRPRVGRGFPPAVEGRGGGVRDKWRPVLRASILPDSGRRRGGAVFTSHEVSLQKLPQCGANVA